MLTIISAPGRRVGLLALPLMAIVGCNSILGVDRDYEVGVVDGGSTASGTGSGVGGGATGGGGTAGDGGSAGNGGGAAHGGSGAAGGAGGGEPTAKRVFVTTAAEDGNFGSGSSGPAYADGLCQSVASSKGLGGSWMAWLSASGSAAQARFTQSTLPYELLDGTRIADDWADLTDGNLAHAIDVDEDGQTISGTWEVWTGTTAGGGTTPLTCAGWQDATGAQYARIGTTDQSDANWTNRYDQFCDRTNVHFYCFEQ